MIKASNALQVVPTAAKDTLYDYSRASGTASARREWQVYLQAGAGIVADSVRRRAYKQAGSSSVLKCSNNVW